MYLGPFLKFQPILFPTFPVAREKQRDQGDEAEVTQNNGDGRNRKRHLGPLRRDYRDKKLGSNQEQKDTEFDASRPSGKPPIGIRRAWLHGHGGCTF